MNLDASQFDVSLEDKRREVASVQRIRDDTPNISERPRLFILAAGAWSFE